MNDATLPPPRRVLVAAHNHPALSKGGAEIAAWRLFEGLRDTQGWQAWFLGCGRNGDGRTGSPITQPFSEREFLYATGAFDWFKFANRDPRYPEALAEMLRDLRPDVLHFHHYVNFGVESFLIARRTLPDCRIVLTLHEYQAICNHYGQMVTRQAKVPCHAASPRDCQRCFPEFSRSDFHLRRAYIQRFLALVDHFVAPSRFLAERYIAWGLPAQRVSVIENATAPRERPPAPARRGGLFHVAFFGQISYLKGIHVLLDAARLLEDAGETGIQIDIHGDHTGQPPEFQADFLERLGKAGRNVQFHGPYDNNRVDALMDRVDVVAVPSIWWENSPVVIQECLRNGKPVLCSDIGGMAEKVRDGLDGFHVPVGNAAALAQLISELAAEPARLAAVAETMRRPAGVAQTVAEHVRLYEGLGLPGAAPDEPVPPRRRTKPARLVSP